MCLWKEDNNVNCCCLWNIQSYKKKEEKKDYKNFNKNNYGSNLEWFLQTSEVKTKVERRNGKAMI